MEAFSNVGYPVVAAEAPLADRLAFLKKVYGLLSISVLLAAGAAWMTMNNQGFLVTVYQNMILFFVLEIAAIFFVMWARKKETLGLVALYGFTMLTGVTTAPILVLYTGSSVVNAAMMTGIIFAGLSFYTITTKKDFSFLGGMLVTGLILMIVGGLLNLLIFHSTAFSFFTSSIGAFLFSGFILYDTSQILHRYPTDEYISATLALYLDILNLFLILLRLFGGSRD